jgi:carbamoyltransferase
LPLIMGTAKNILGISAYYHDSAAAIVVGGSVIAAAQEERFSRKKNDSEFPVKAIQFCLEEAGLNLADLDAVVFYDKPLLKFERLIETYYAFAPKGILSFLKSMPVWLKDKLFLKSRIIKCLKELGQFDIRKTPILFTEHHLAQAASSFFASSFKEAAIVTIDGVGEWTTASIAMGTDKQIKIVKELHFPHSVGLLYSAFTYYLGFKVNSGEYKLMGLAPYGNAKDEETQRFISLIKTHLVRINSDGSIWLDQSYFFYSYGLKMTNDKKWEQLFGLKRRESETDITQRHCNLAYAIQNVTEEIVLLIVKEAKLITGYNQLCMAGGVALNCVANGKLLPAAIFENIYIQPAAGDAGGAIGCALVAAHMFFDEPRVYSEESVMQHSYLGPDFTDKDIFACARKHKISALKLEGVDEVVEFAAERIASGKIIGWFQGKMEFGPRALGNRSILADPRNPEIQKTLNLKIKYREGFRPFAPVVTAEDAHRYFLLDQPSPYMLFVAGIRPELRYDLPANYEEMQLFEKLYFQRSSFPAITHLDYSARVQTVTLHSNKKLYLLLKAFQVITGTPMLVNTSFNVRGEPIVCTPDDAYNCFVHTEMDILIMNDFIFEKSGQERTITPNILLD